jgi:hypothetical protein
VFRVNSRDGSVALLAAIAIVHIRTMAHVREQQPTLALFLCRERNSDLAPGQDTGAVNRDYWVEFALRGASKGASNMTDMQAKVREAVGVFKNAKTLQGAIDELLSSGFDHAELSLLAGEEAVERELGQKYTRVAELEDDPRVPRKCYISKESVGAAEGALIGGLFYVGACLAGGAVVVAGGTLVSAIVAAVAFGGSGGLIGAVLAKIIDDIHAMRIEEQLEHGGLVLWVRTWNEGDERRAVDILQRHSGEDVHVHSLSRSQS